METKKNNAGEQQPMDEKGRYTFKNFHKPMVQKKRENGNIGSMSTFDVWGNHSIYTPKTNTLKSVSFKGKEYKPIGKETIQNGDDFVKQNMSNEIRPFKREEKVDIEKVKSRGNLSDAEARKAIELSNNINMIADKNEPEITKDIVETAKGVGATMFGLDFRKKQTTSLAGKLGSDAITDNITIEEASKQIKDAVRYTAILDENNFVNQYEKMKQALERKGYKEVKCKNNFENYQNGVSPQNDVNCTFENKNGYKFELQFHTIRSQAIKEKYNHELYEIVRQETTPKNIKEELNKLIINAGSYVKQPENISRIKSHK